MYVCVRCVYVRVRCVRCVYVCDVCVRCVGGKGATDFCSKSIFL